MIFADVIRVLLLLVLIAVALVGFLQWRRRGGPAARWVFASFALLATVTLVFRIVPDEPRAGAEEWLGKVALAALPLFPFSLYRFTAALTRAPRWLDWTSASLTAVVVVLTLVIPDAALGDRGPSALTLVYTAALIVPWTFLSLAVAIRLWRAGRREPTVARRRMRTLSLGSVGLTFALVLAGAAPEGESISLVIRLIALASGFLFLLGFAPPAWLRAAWRRAEEERLRAAIADLMAATRKEHVTSTLLPHVVNIVGGRAAALLDGDQRVVGSHGFDEAPADALEAGAPRSPAVAGDPASGRIELALPTGTLVVTTSPYTPFFGSEELALLRSLGALAELALERVELYEREREARLGLEREKEFSQLLISSSGDGILAFDRDFRYTLWNPGMERITGISAAEAVGRRAFDLFPFLEEIGEDEALRAALAGREITTSDRPYVVPETGREGFFESRYAPLYGGAGEIVGGLSIVRDTTDRKRAADERERRLREASARAEAEARAETLQLLAGFTETAGAHLTFDDLLAELLERVSRALEVDTAAILLLERDARTLAVHAAKGLEEEVERRTRIPLAEGFAGRVAARRRATTLDDVGGEVVSPVLAEKGVSSLLGVPLLVAGRLIGVLHVGTLLPHDFSSDERTLLQLIADRVAAVVEQASVYEQEHRIAETLQRNLLPARLPQLPGVALTARYRAGSSEAEVGGDWYDAVPLRSGRLALVVGDVAGRGIRAASVMGQLRSAARAYALDDRAPAHVVTRLNELAQSLDDGDMATLVYLVFSPDARTVRLVNAGHPPPLVLGPDRNFRYLEGGRSQPVGVLAGARYEEASETLEPGSTMLIYTDGLVERRGEGIRTGLDRLGRAAASGPQDLQALCDHVLDSLLGGEELADDVALLALRLLPAPERLELRLPAEPGSVTSIRRALTHLLTGAGAGAEEIYHVTLACSEAAANVVEHAYGPEDAVFEVDAMLEDKLVVIKVRDFGRWRAPRGEDRGRGLTLMEDVMDHVEVVRGTDGTEVRMRRRIAREAA